MNWLTLEQFRKSISYHPYHFWGLGDSDALRPSSTCNTYVQEYAWQSAYAAGRSEIYNAIEQAESKIRNFLKYALMPHYVEETLPWPQYLDKRLYRMGAMGGDGSRLQIQLSEGKVLAVGPETLTLLSSPAVTYSDANLDGILDTFTITQATALTDASKLQVYFSVADRYTPAPLERWRIRPITVSFSGGTATIKGRIWQVAKPILYEKVQRPDVLFQPVNPATVTNFPATLDVYSSETNVTGQTTVTSQCVLLWDTLPCDGWWCCASDQLNWTPADARYDPAGMGMAMGRVGIHDGELGIVLPAQALYNSTTGQWAESWTAMGREPQRVTIRYKAGDALAADGELKLEWQTLITRMACAELASRICACDETNKEIYRWQVDLTARTVMSGETYNAPPKDLENPFGVRAGQVEAWRRIKILAKMRGIHV